MLGFFPTLYPDELLYSSCARYYDITNYPSKTKVLQELFGSNGTSALINFPRYLTYFISVLPPGHSYTAKKIINEHTLIPFFSPYIPESRLNRIIESMSGDRGLKILTSIINHPGLAKPNDWLRFCPICSEEDLKKFGEYYWHRTHQMIGIEVCPIHNVFLENTSIPVRKRVRNYELISANKVIKKAIARPLDLSCFFHQVLRTISIDIAWPANLPNLITGHGKLYNRLIILFIENGLATKMGTIRYKELEKKIVRY